MHNTGPYRIDSGGILEARGRRGEKEWDGGGAREEIGGERKTIRRPQVGTNTRGGEIPCGGQVR